MKKYNTVVCGYDNILLNVNTTGSCLLHTTHTHTHTHTHTPNQELHMRPHLSRFCHNTPRYCILSF